MVPTDAIIDNENLKITNLNVTFEEPQTGSAWAFVIQNKGKYDAYLKETNNYNLSEESMDVLQKIFILTLCFYRFPKVSI